MEYRHKSSYRSSGKYYQNPSGGLQSLFLFYILPFVIFNGLLFYCITSTPKVTLELHDTNSSPSILTEMDFVGNQESIITV